MDSAAINLNMAHNNTNLFSWFDYILFCGMLGISVIIGIYFGFFGKKQNTADEYLKGGKQMSPVPIAISLIASHISTSTLLAVPGDIYKFGSNYLWIALGTIIECTIAYYVYFPVFFKLQLTSVFEYIHLRFDKKLRILTSAFGVLSLFVYCPIVVYIPSLAFAQVTGVNVYLMAVLTSIICIFYTTVGGLKAVVWTDTLQFFIMIITFVVIFFMGVTTVGGFKFIWSKSVDGQRLDVLDFSFDPTLRDSFGALIIGGTVQWLTFTAIGQDSVQKILSLPTYKEVTKMITFYSIGMASFHIFATFFGLLLYGRYWNCDPLLTKEIARSEQLVPHFVMEVACNFPGLPGVFIAGVYSAGLSSLSASLNTMSAVIYKDFVSPFLPKNISQKRISNILKLIVLVCGTISTLLVLIIEKLGGVFALYIGLMAVTLGPTLGIFTLGMLIPKANSKGAFFGALISSVVVAWVTVQNQRYQSQIIEKCVKPISVDGCNATIGVVEIGTKVNSNELDSVFILYRISFWLYGVIGFVMTMVIGIIVSCFTKHDKEHVPSKLLSPIVHYFLKENDSIELSSYDNCKTDQKIKTERPLIKEQDIIK